MEAWEKDLPAGVTADNVKALRAAGWRCTPPEGAGGMKMPKSPMMALFEDEEEDSEYGS